MSNRVLRILDSGVRVPRWNVAMTAALAELHADGAISDTLRFHRYSACVLLGRHQSAVAAAHLDYCCQQGIELARRVTGGGAVYMAPGILAWDLVLHRRELTAQLADAAAIVSEAVVEALRGFGLEAAHRAPNDVIVDARKISGSSGLQSGGSLLVQGTVLVDYDMAEMERSLILPAGRSPQDVVSLCDLLPAPLAMAQVIDVLSAAIASAFGRIPQADVATPAETALTERLLTAEIGRDDFVFDENLRSAP